MSEDPIYIDTSRFDRRLPRVQQALREGLVEALKQNASLGQKFARRNLRPYRHVPTLRLEEAIRTEVNEEALSARVFVDDQAAPEGKYLEVGTGIYGPKGRPIVPVRARFLVFVIPETGRVIYATKVRGVRPRRFMQKARVQLRGVAPAETSRILMRKLREADRA